MHRGGGRRVQREVAAGRVEDCSLFFYSFSVGRMGSSCHARSARLQHSRSGGCSLLASTVPQKRPSRAVPARHGARCRTPLGPTALTPTAMIAEARGGSQPHPSACASPPPLPTHASATVHMASAAAPAFAPLTVLDACRPPTVVVPRVNVPAAAPIGRAAASRHTPPAWMSATQPPSPPPTPPPAWEA